MQFIQITWSILKYIFDQSLPGRETIGKKQPILCRKNLFFYENVIIFG